MHLGLKVKQAYKEKGEEQVHRVNPVPKDRRVLMATPVIKVLKVCQVIQVLQEVQGLLVNQEQMDLLDLKGCEALQGTLVHQEVQALKANQGQTVNLDSLVLKVLEAYLETLVQLAHLDWLALVVR